MRSQAVGLAEATGIPFTEKQVRLRAPWSWLPGHRCPRPIWGLSASHDQLRPPWPELLISCGRRSTALSIAIRKYSRGRTRTVHVQDPQAPPGAFDLVIPMRHDGLAGENVFPVDTALHGISPTVLAEGDRIWRVRLKSAEKQLLGVILGGANRYYRFGAEAVDNLAGIVEDARRRDMNVIVTPSRRTEPEIIDLLQTTFGSDPGFSLWDGSGENPYVGILAVADRLVVTGESVSMVSEALATGRPVHILRLEGSGRRHERFLENLVRKSMISVIDGRRPDWTWQGCPPVDSTPEAAKAILGRLGMTRSA